MKARIALFLLALSAVALAAWEVFMLSGKVRTHAFVYNETGLRLPAEVRIVSTRSHLFSLVDGVNYEWLIQACRTDWIVQSDYEWMTQALPSLVAHDSSQHVLTEDGDEQGSGPESRALLMRLAENQRLLTPDVRRGKGYEGQKTQKEQLIGIQIKLKMDLTLEGYRPKGIVRFYPPTWKVIALPWEEEFFGKE